MMVSIHAAVGIGTSLLFRKKAADKPEKKIYIILLACNVALHGIMDLIPHSHPLPSYVDIGIALSMPTFLISFAFMKKLKRIDVILMLSGYTGGLLPDIIDLGVFRVLGLGAFKFFPWHYI
ncbi:MAG: hypothetical protein FWG45_02330 [Oscillospiraceae bacterium]|nr:hypothetical protein [Oscillospiraceae bacterium]